MTAYRPPVLQHAIATLLADVRAAGTDHAGIEAITLAVRKHILNERTPATAKLYLHHYRTALKEAFGPDHPAVGMMSGAGLRTQPRKRPTINDVLDGLLKELRQAGDQTAVEKIAAIAAGAKASILEFAPATAKRYLVLARQAIAEALGDDHPAIAMMSGAGLSLTPKSWVTAGSELPAPSVAKEQAPRQDTTTAADKVERAETLNSVGRKPTLQAKIAQFVAAVAKCPNPKAAEELWNLEFASLAHLADTTRLNYVARYRNELVKAYGEDTPLLEIVAAPLELSSKVQADYAGRIVQQHRALAEIPAWSAIVERSRALLTSSDPLTIGIGLLVLTGRRPVEIFTSAVFERAPIRKGAGKTYTRWSVLFSGQAKTRGKEGTRFGQFYEIPTLAPAGEIVDALSRLRASADAQTKLAVTATSVPMIRWSEMTSEQFRRGDSVYGKLMQAFAVTFEDLWPDGVPLTPYEFRALYAEIAYKQFAPQTISKNSFFAAILGHTAKDLETSHSYLKFFLPDPTTRPGDHDEADEKAERLVHRIEDRLISIKRLPNESS